MAQEVVVNQALTETAIAAGAELLRRLDGMGWSASAAFWLYVPESQQWRLVIASTNVSLAGPKSAYTVVQKAISGDAVGALPLRLSDISVVEPSHPIVRLFLGAMGTGPGISGVRFSGNVINGVLIEDAFIYRLTGVPEEPSPGSAEHDDSALTRSARPNQSVAKGGFDSSRKSAKPKRHK